MKKREQNKWGLNTVEYDPSPASEIMRKAYKNDFMLFLKDIWFHGHEKHQTSLGLIHEYLCDFLCLEHRSATGKPLVAFHSRLPSWLPERNSDGEYKERWVYLPTLTGEPQIEDGSGGAIESMFQDQEWRGTIFRFAGDMRDRCILLPRGHLKSTIGNEAHSLWSMVRDPSLRLILRSHTHDLAKKSLSTIKQHFQTNTAFIKCFGNLGPPEKYENIWSQTDIQVRTDSRRGGEPTISSFGLGSEVTGRHCDWIKCDDVVGEQNTGTREQKEKVRHQVQNLEAVRDPGSYFFDIGTIWADDDAHREYIRRDGHS